MCKVNNEVKREVIKMPEEIREQLEDIAYTFDSLSNYYEDKDTKLNELYNEWVDKIIDEEIDLDQAKKLLQAAYLINDALIK